MERSWDGPRTQSALNLRLVLAVFGALFGATGTGLAAVSGQPAYVVALFAALTAVAAVNVAYVQRRRRRRARAEGGRRHSLFE